MRVWCPFGKEAAISVSAGWTGSLERIKTVFLVMDFSSAQAGLWQQRCDFLSRRTLSNWELKQERKKNWAETCENTVFPNCVHTASV